MTDRKIPVLLVTGFLGAGKTTLINRILDFFSEKEIKTAVLINEFGAASVDSFLVNAGEMPVFEVNRGSIFCSCAISDFISVIDNICGESQLFDLILVEATGISEIGNISRYLNLPPINGRAYVASTICVVDCFNFHKVFSVVKAAREQVASADIIFLNKTGLAGENLRDKQIRLVKDINSLVPVLNWDGEKITDEFFPGGLSNYKAADKEGDICHLPPENIVSVTLKSEKIIDREKLHGFLKRYSDRLYRAKGIVFYKEGTYLVEWTMSGITERIFESDKKPDFSFVVLIGKELDKINTAIDFKDTFE